MRHLLLVLVILCVPARQADDVTLDADGVPIRFTVQGEEGDALVLLHGFAANLEMFRMAGLVDLFAKDYRVISIDARGHGKSGKPHAPDAYGIEMVEDVVRILDFMEIEAAHVLGYSMGGMITAKLVMTHPDRVLSAVVGAYGWPEPVPPGEGLMDRLAASLEAGTGFGPLLRALTPEGAPPMSDAELAMADRMLLGNNDALALAAVARGFHELAVQEDELRANEVPTLAIVGADDPLAADVVRMEGVMANLDVVMIEGADHTTAGMSSVFRESAVGFLGGRLQPAASGAGRDD